MEKNILLCAKSSVGSGMTITKRESFLDNLTALIIVRKQIRC